MAADHSIRNNYVSAKRPAEFVALLLVTLTIIPTVGCQQMPSIEHEVLAAAGIVAVDQTTFQSTVLDEDKPVIVDFWASWCGPCKLVDPILLKTAERYKDRIVIAKVDIDQNEQLAGAYSVEAIPTIVFFANGREQQRIRGVPADDEIAGIVDELIARDGDANRAEDGP